jgi:uncharacterized protein DUF481
MWSATSGPLTLTRSVDVTVPATAGEPPDTVLNPPVTLGLSSPRKRRSPLRTIALWCAALTVCTTAQLSVLPQPVSAQVNVEALRRDDPPVGRSGQLGGDIAIRTGNVDFVALNFRVRGYLVTDTETRLMIANGGVGFLDRSRFASSGLLHYRRSYTAVSERFTPEWYGQLNYDRPQLLSFRAVGGAGARASFARGEWGQFGAGSTMMLEYENLSLPDTAAHPDQTLEVRWSNFLTLRIVPSETLVITSTTYVQPALASFGDYRALENLRIAASITETLALTVSFDLRYDSRAPGEIASLDTSLRTGITYTY